MIATIVHEAKSASSFLPHIQLQYRLSFKIPYEIRIFFPSAFCPLKLIRYNQLQGLGSLIHIIIGETSGLIYKQKK